MKFSFGGKGPKPTLAEQLGARFGERLARVIAKRTPVFSPPIFSLGRDKRKSVSLRKRPIVIGHAAPVAKEGGADGPAGKPVSGTILFLAGPTASGKSALALALAEATGAEIVNADSMQVYIDLDILAARPSPEEVERATHHMYGYVDAGDAYSVARWSTEAIARLEGIAARERPAIVVGGTGLYFKALTDGLADVPDPGPEAEAFARDVLNTRGVEALRSLALQLDPVGAARVGATDRQRLLRLVAVARGLGRPLSELRAQTTPPKLPAGWRGLIIEPDREHLYRRVDLRAHRMMEEGAVEEAVRLVRRGLSPEAPAMKALGVTTLAAYHEGALTREAALDMLARDTRRYAKRQLTWFRHQTADWARLSGPNVEAALAAWREPGAGQ